MCKGYETHSLVNQYYAVSIIAVAAGRAANNELLVFVMSQLTTTIVIILTASRREIFVICYLKHKHIASANYDTQIVDIWVIVGKVTAQNRVFTSDHDANVSFDSNVP